MATDRMTVLDVEPASLLELRNAVTVLAARCQRLGHIAARDPQAPNWLRAELAELDAAAHRLVTAARRDEAERIERAGV